jgi:hypothetical protein
VSASVAVVVVVVVVAVVAVVVFVVSPCRAWSLLAARQGGSTGAQVLDGTPRRASAVTIASVDARVRSKQRQSEANLRNCAGNTVKKMPINALPVMHTTRSDAERLMMLMIVHPSPVNVSSCCVAHHVMQCHHISWLFTAHIMSMCLSYIVQLI